MRARRFKLILLNLDQLSKKKKRPRKDMVHGGVQSEKNKAHTVHVLYVIRYRRSLIILLMISRNTPRKESIVKKPMQQLTELVKDLNLK